MNWQNIKIKILKFLCYATLVVGILLVIGLFFGNHSIIMGFLAIFGGQTSGYLVFIYITVTILLLKSKNKERSPKSYYGIMIVGLFITGSFTLPLLLTPSSVTHAEKEFKEAFGPNWKDNIPPTTEKHFLKKPFNLPRYFLGKPNKNCKIDQNIKYYENEGITLHFDVYHPIEKAKNLPGNRSTIINIHGGGWRQGDKGMQNMTPVSKYLASQGYVVFDIQYGLMEKVRGPSYLGRPSYVVGDFTVDEQVRHIGVFTKKLEENIAQRYDANLDRVYVMGRSAGGHLTGVLGLGYNEDYFDGIFAENLNIKGIAPIYPAVDSELFFDTLMPNLLEGNPENNPELFKHYDPSEIVDENDPPAIIYQGTSDGLVPPQQSKMLEDAMEDNQIKCCRLLLPLAGHASDFLNNANYSQVWMYYLERFLYLSQ